MPSLPTVHRAALATHVLLLLAVLGAAATTGLPPPVRFAAAAAAATPLLLAFPGLRRARRYTCLWLAVVLVLYVGAAAVEVVAAAGRAPLAALVLFAALLELGALVLLIRRLPRSASRGRTES